MSGLSFPPTSLFTAAAPPTNTSDAARGYRVGERMTDTTTGMVWTCLDATPGQALWRPDIVKPLVAVGGRNALPDGVLSGAFEALQSRIICRNTLDRPVTNLRLRFPNFRIRDAAPYDEVPIANACNIQGAIEYPLGGARYPLTFNGEAIGVVQAGGITDSDPVPIVIPPGAQYAKISWIEAAPGGSVPFGNDTMVASNAAGDRTQNGTSGSVPAITATGEAFNTSGSFAEQTYIATCLGEVAGWAPTTIIMGDSIAAGLDYSNPPQSGTKENSWAGGDAHGNHGYVERMLHAAGVPFVNLSRSGVTVRDLAADPRRMARRLQFVGDVGSTVLVQLGANDLTGSADSAAQIVVNQGQLATAFRAMNMKVGFTTILPITNIGNNATHASETRRRSYNDSVKALGIDGQSFFIDPAAAVENATTHLWTNGAWAYDGLHPNKQGHDAIAAGTTAWQAR